MKTRTLAHGKKVHVHSNNGLRKRCGCPRRSWASCSHPWAFSFKWRGTHHRFAVDKYAGEPITDKDKARTEADRLRGLIRSGHFPPAAATPPTTPEALTFEDYSEKWWKYDHGRKPVQQACDKSRLSQLRKIVVSGRPLGEQQIGTLTVDTWETVFAGLRAQHQEKYKRELAGSSWNKYRQLVVDLQRWGVKKGHLLRVWLPDLDELKRKPGAQRDRRLVPDELDEHSKVKTRGEERRLLANASPWLQRLIIAALETCCRRGELLSLQWKDVSLSRGLFTIRAEKAKDGETRHLPISPRLKGVLEMVRHDPDGEQHKPDAYVFGDAIGGKISDPKKAWQRCCRDAAVSDLHFHDLRHEAGSRLLEAGWPLSHVQAMLGHADISTTSTYLNTTVSHVMDSMTRFGTRSALHGLAPEAHVENRPAVQQASKDDSKVLVN